MPELTPIAVLPIPGRSSATVATGNRAFDDIGLVGRVGLALLLAIICTGGGLGPADAQSVPPMVVLVRHADYASGSGNDPALNAAGYKRADDLAAALRHSGITAILTSQYRRTRETAAPLASTLGVMPSVMNAGDIAAHVNELATTVRNHRDGAILVVGHSNTVPALIKALGGPGLPNICDNAFDRLFVVVLSGGKALLTRTRYGDASGDARPECM